MLCTHLKTLALVCLVLTSVLGRCAGQPTPRAAALHDVQADTGAVVRNAAASYWGNVDKEIAAVISDEHRVEMAMPLSPTADEHRTLMTLRQAVFALASAGPARDKEGILLASRHVEVCCLFLGRA
jgi:hypothetical protein